MTNDARLISRFRVSDDDLEKDQTIKEVYDDYCDKRWKFGQAASELKEATKKLYAALDWPLRSQGLVPEGRGWSFKEDDDDGICISVLSEPPRRGRQRSEIPVRQLSLTTASANNGGSSHPDATVKRFLGSPRTTS
jgi:hypothetical protein